MIDRRILPRRPLAILLVLFVLCGTAAGASEGQRAFAERMYQACLKGTPKPQLSQTDLPATLERAYAIQGLLVDRLMGKDGIGGFKAAVVGAQGQAGLGIDGPLTAVVPASGVLEASDAVTIDLAGEPVRFLETEVGYVLDSVIDKPLADVETLKQHVRHVVPVVEVPGGASENVEPVTAADLVARNIDSMAIILGARHRPEAIAVDDLRITLTHGKKVINTAHGAMAAGGQWETLRKTVNTLLEQGYTLTPGQAITNGALGNIRRAEPGPYRADFGALGAFTFTVINSEETG